MNDEITLLIPSFSQQAFNELPVFRAISLIEFGHKDVRTAMIACSGITLPRAITVGFAACFRCRE